MKNTITAILMLVYSALTAQGPVITPLKGNVQLRGNAMSLAAKRAITDTLVLPFMDDFSTTKLYPDPLYWMDNQVYVNDHFAVSPPSYGVATFDNLDSKGRPYQALSGGTHSHSDSLTSNPINLKNYKNGLNTLDYTPADSIYLSFFYQTQGLGDPLDNSDSLVLKFRNAGGFWKTVWKTGGTSLKDFKQVLIGITQAEYLIAGFQFRFINFGKTTGNMNQWHLDYVRLNSGRNRFDTLISDVAINAIPVGPLQWYESMPYDHYLASPAFHRSADHKVIIRNNNSNGVNVAFKYEVRNTYNQLVLSVPFSSSARNIAALSDSSERFSSFTFDTLSGKSPELRIKYALDPKSSDFLPGNYNSSGNNNEYTKTVKFRNYLAYDDGSAEGGYGLDYGSLPNGPGYAAIKFNSSKPDTLRGISVFFNRSVADAQFKAYTLIVWKTISEPPANTMANDVILKRIDMATAIYKDSLNGFTDIVFDTALYLPQGSFYIGWQQNTKYILNVGYDNNYKYAKTGGRNPNLFYNLNGYWENVNSTISGAVMMRPLLGDPIKSGQTASLSHNSTDNGIVLYPNPGFDHVNISAAEPIVKLKVYNMSGQLLQATDADAIQAFSTSALPPGIYMLVLTDSRGRETRHKWSK